MPKGRPWTEDEINRLCFLWPSDMLICGIASDLDRTVNAIDNKRKKLKLPHRKRGEKRRNPVHQLKAGDSIVVKLTRAETSAWRKAARRANAHITTKQIMLKGEVCYRVTRIAA